MKFCAYLKKVDDNVPAVFKGGFLNYKALKKFIKYRARRLEASEPDSHAREELALTSERDIFFMLCNQLKEVDRSAMALAAGKMVLCMSAFIRLVHLSGLEMAALR